MLKFIMESIFLIESLKSAKEFATKTNISVDIFDKLNELDTTPTKKLIHQILKWYVGDSSMIDKLDDVTNKLKIFIKFSGGRIKDPIEKFKTFEEFTTFITPFLDIETKAEKKDSLIGQYKKIFENESMLIVLPFTHKASCIYGAKTKWCTTAKTANHFNSYMNHGNAIYYILNKLDNNTNNPFHKMAVVVNPDGGIDECYDTFDSYDYTKQIQNWISEHGVDIKKTLVPMSDHPEFIKVNIHNYKKLKYLMVDDDNIKSYVSIIEMNILDEAFPILEVISFRNYESVYKSNVCLQVPKSVKKVILDRNTISDLTKINRENLNISIELTGNSIRKFKNCDKLSSTIVFEGYNDGYRGKMELVRNMVCNSPFKSMKMKTNYYSTDSRFNLKDKLITIFKYRKTGGVPPKIVKKPVKKKK